MTHAIITSREIRLAARPEGMPSPSDFALASVEVGPPGPGEVLVRNRWMSVDPYMRGRMRDAKSYVPPFQVGAALEGGAVGEVLASNVEGLAPGDRVLSMLGWREAFTASPRVLTKLPDLPLPDEAFLGVAGMPGLTAWVGLTRIAGVKAGETVFVSAASGAVGSIVAQIAKARGARVVGSAGGLDKCAWLREIGVDAAIDYRAEPDMTAALRRAAPDGIHVYFDNVGGDHLEAALAAARDRARFALCGAISMYNATEAQGIRNLFLAVAKRLRLEGFIVSDHMALMPEFLREMAGLIESGAVVWRQSVDEGIEAAPGAFLKLFSGEKIGKMLVRLDGA